MTPDDFTLGEFWLNVGDGHKLYVQDWGHKAAKNPVIFLHGGPGSGSRDSYKISFNPKRHRVIFFDQRGSGKSTPFGSLNKNTTQDLVEDIAKVADKLKLDRFILTGGSWGACLGLLFAIKYPEKVIELVIRGVFTGSQSEIDWLDEGLFQKFFPDIWEEYLKSVPQKYRKKPSSYHYDQALGNQTSKAKMSAYEFSKLELSLLSLDDRHSMTKFADFDPTSTIIEMYYLKNKCFLPDKYIFKNAHRLEMPVWIIQGRYDMVCPPSISHELCKRIPNCQIIWTMAGHSSDRSNYDVFRTLMLKYA